MVEISEDEDIAPTKMYNLQVRGYYQKTSQYQAQMEVVK